MNTEGNRNDMSTSTSYNQGTTTCRTRILAWSDFLTDDQIRKHARIVWYLSEQQPNKWFSINDLDSALPLRQGPRVSGFGLYEWATTIRQLSDRRASSEKGGASFGLVARLFFGSSSNEEKMRKVAMSIKSLTSKQVQSLLLTNLQIRYRSIVFTTRERLVDILPDASLLRDSYTDALMREKEDSGKVVRSTGWFKPLRQPFGDIPPLTQEQ
eukprot:Tbor_TRINITY_DN10299_c0_g1::TRINITY_DN10299_c0_g1_i1::g.5374::m.5374